MAVIAATGDDAENASRWVDGVRFRRRARKSSLSATQPGADVSMFETVTRVLHPWLDASGERSPVTWRQRAQAGGLSYGPYLWHLDFREARELWCWEGQLDARSRHDVVDVLAAVSSSDVEVSVFYGTSAIICGLEPTLFEAQLCDVDDICARFLCFGSESPVIGPESWWALDGSWLVETGYDDTSTDLHGSPLLAQLLLEHPNLEAMSLK